MGDKIVIGGHSYEFRRFTMPTTSKKISTEKEKVKPTGTDESNPDKEKYPINIVPTQVVSEDQSSEQPGAARSYDDFSFLKATDISVSQPGSPNQPQPTATAVVMHNITKEEDGMKYSSDNPTKPKPTKATDNVPVDFKSDFAEVETPIATKHDQIPDFAGCVDNKSNHVDSVDIMGVAGGDAREEKYKFMRDVRLAAEKAGYGIMWKESVSVDGRKYITGYLTNQGVQIGNKAFMIDYNGVIFNRLIKIFIVKDGFYVEACNAYALYDRDKKFNEETIVKLFQGGEDAVHPKEACYKGLDKSVNIFVDIVSIDVIKDRNLRKSIKDRIFNAYKAGIFDDSDLSTFNRFRIVYDSIQMCGNKAVFTLINDSPRHFGEPVYQDRKIELRFGIDSATVVKF